MKRLKQVDVGSESSVPFHFEGEVKTFKEFISNLCQGLSEIDELSFYVTVDEEIRVEITKFSVESDEDYKERLLKRKQTLEEDVAKLNTELNQLAQELK